MATIFNLGTYFRDFHGNPRSYPSIPSVPTSPGPESNGFHENRDIYRTSDKLNANIYLKTHAPPGQSHLPSSTRLGSDTDYGKEIIQESYYNDDHIAVPLVIPSEQSSFVNKSDSEKGFANSNSVIQNHGVQNDKWQTLSNDFPEVPRKQVLGDVIKWALPNEAVLTSDGLAKTVDIPNTNEEEILTANDMIITPAINFDDINKKLLSNKKYIDPNMPAKTFLQLLNKEADGTNDPIVSVTSRKESVEKNVDWDDMFDTELFENIKDPMPIKTRLEDGTHNNFKIEFPKDKKKQQRKFNNKVTKRKTETIANGTLSKTVKNILSKESITEKTIKKVNSTKAVKNWLDDIDPNLKNEIGQYGASDMTVPKTTKAHVMNVDKSPYDDESSTVTKTTVIETSKQPEETVKTSESLIRALNQIEELNRNFAMEINGPKFPILDVSEAAKNSLDKVIDKKPKTKNKKVVQSRLAEKDGKMKFGPPVKVQKESKTEETRDDQAKNKEAVKDKKEKSKFVPPIKSQIPVKNLTFDVTTIDESNLHFFYDVLKSEDNIVMILIYKNGFCQLNNHHTEDGCIIEGIMIQWQEKFFYFKDNERHSDLLKQLLKKCQVICYNAKPMLIYLISKYGVELKQEAFNLCDAKIGGSLIDPDNPPENFEELQKLLGFTPEFTIATECVLQKAAWYITLLRECFDNLKSLLTENCVWNVFIGIEMPLLPVIAGMEHRGVSVDLEKLKSMEDILLTKMKLVEQECYRAAGKTFQINSTLQVRTILYDELQLDTKNNLKIKETIAKGAKSTSETMLRGLVSVHPLPRFILEYRHLHKAHATFLTGIAQHVKEGSVKPTWVQMAAATGRIASNNPNLQAIPKAPFSLVVFPQNSADREPTLNFRSVYTARPSHCFIAADFKHIECRVFAHAADDATLQDALRSGQDLFRVLAAKWLNKPVDEVSSEDRERTKRIVYASLYGAGARKLTEILHNIGYEQALGVMSSFNRTFPALKSFGRAVVAKAASGALRSLCGRARRFPHIASADPTLRAQAERQAVNFIVQGSAADLCKKAMVAVQRRLESTQVNCRLVLQIHDELVWEVADDHVDKAAEIIKYAMENVGRDSGMNTILPIELTRGRNWGEMRSFED
ncbi:DNA polymerase nu-like [Cydia pomonella]|uniref:DNA polymerase nu-like n=1 Tax=Cydia pomonella TaxID=82600 RepID=UPI002ADE23C9|nr:DNA polymerase nu-like [Cydia pomonella]